MQLTNKIYRENHAQDNILLQEKFSSHKGMAQIPVFFTTDHEIDFDVMRKTIDIEIERNDALRDKITKDKKKGSITQTFVEPYRYADVNGEIPLVDFTGKTEEEQKNYIKSLGCTPVRYEDFNLFNVVFVKTFDNRYGLYLSITHMVSDAWGTFVTLSDILGVYLALKNGTEMPKPLASFEACLEKDITEHGEDSVKEDVEFFAESITRFGKPTRFTEVINENLPHRHRNKTVSKWLYYNTVKAIFNDKSENIVYKLPKETFDLWTKFCEENSTNLNTLILFGMSVYFSKINNSNDFLLAQNCNCRATIADKHSAGDRATALYMRNYPKDSDTAAEVIDQLQNIQNQIFRHAFVRTRLIVDLFMKDFKISQYTNNGGMQYSCVLLPLNVPEEWHCDYEFVSSGHFTVPEYIFVMPDISNNSAKFSFEFQTAYLNDIQIKAQFEGIVNAVNECVKNKNITYKHIKEII